MSHIRKWIRFLFGFSRTETNGFMVLLPLLAVLLFAEPISRWATGVQKPDVLADQKILDSILVKWSTIPDSLPGKNKLTIKKPVRHNFDPNTASIKEFEELGLSGKVAGNITKYRAKGGTFKVKSDLLRVYGMDSTLYKTLFNYIRLPEKLHHEFTATATPTRKEIIKFDLNEADSSELKKIYGIGDRLAARIISYRQNLGGFIHTGQLTEVYGLDTTVVNRILERSYIIESFIPKKLNINVASDRELSAHPYISAVIAKAIVTYRFQHGNFATVEDIRNLHNLKKEEADKIIPYISVNP
jgi:competence protein ComEA